MRTIMLFMALTLSACVAINVERRADMPIAAARLQAQATPVRVEGNVTVAPGSFDGGFALQDASGGIYVTRPIGVQLKPGDRVRVGGRIVAPNNQVSIEPTAIELLGTGDVPASFDIRSGSVGPATEGRLISVRGKVFGNVIDDLPWGWKAYLDDGSGPLLIFIASATKIDVKNLRPGLAVRATGFSGRFGQHTELLPRQQADLEIVAE